MDKQYKEIDGLENYKHLFTFCTSVKRWKRIAKQLAKIGYVTIPIK